MPDIEISLSKEEVALYMQTHPSDITLDSGLTIIKGWKINSVWYYNSTLSEPIHAD